MVDVQTQIVIQRPLAEVVAYASNPDHAQKWYVNIKYSNRLPQNTTEPLQLGSF